MKVKCPSLLKNIYNRFIYDLLPSRSAEISYYIFMSFFPFLIFLIMLISYIPIIHLNYFNVWLSKVMPSTAYSIVNYIINRAIDGKNSKLLIVSFFITIYSAASGVRSIISGINKAYDQQETRPLPKIIVICQVFTFGLILLITFSMILVVYGNKISLFIIQFLGFNNILIIFVSKMRYIIALITMFLMLVCLYKFTPNIKLTVREVLPGALFSTIGWILSTMIFSFYANTFVNYKLLYGSIGGIIALLSWLYLISIFILLGAEVNATIDFEKKRKIKRKPPIY